jgi:hypothetical protein
MQNDIPDEHQAYRRGMVLGFTMAEVVLLVIFCLLLTLAYILATKEKEIKKLETMNNNFAVLREQLTKHLPAGEEDFDDYFDRLTIATEKEAEINSLEKEVSALKESDKIVKNIKEQFKKEGWSPNNVNETLNQAIQSHAALVRAKDDMGEKDPVVAIADRDLQIANFRGQIKNLQSQVDDCKGLGKGSSYPPCWADAITGRPEFIYDVEITDNGIIMRSTNLPHRQNEMKKLPLGGIIVDKEVSVINFKKMTAPLYNWSVNNNCRFFVRLFDKTGPTQKVIYKLHRQAVEDHFYILVMTN